MNIEPLTSADWEIMELHARFLELNLLSQIRALPNPALLLGKDTPPQSVHPLTLHLSPTSTANIVVTALTPAPPQSSAFAKIAPDAEVIVAPKTRPRPSRRNSRGVASARSGKSIGEKSAASTIRQRTQRDVSRGALFFRIIDRGIADEWFDEDDLEAENRGFRVWLDKDVVASKELRGTTYVCVTTIKPAGLQEPADPQKQPVSQQADEAGEAGKPAHKLVARVGVWDDIPNTQLAALSSQLCDALSATQIVGGIVRVEAAPPQVDSVKTLKILPFQDTSSNLAEGFRFGGELKAKKDKVSHEVLSIFGKEGNSLFDGPLTDGMILPAAVPNNAETAWQGGSSDSTHCKPLKTAVLPRGLSAQTGISRSRSMRKCANLKA